MLTIDDVQPSDRIEVERLIAEYHVSERIKPNMKRISWAVDLQLRGESHGFFLVAREQDKIVGVVLAVSTPSAELGLVVTVNDFFVKPEMRRRGVGRELAERLIERCRNIGVDEIGLEVLTPNKTAGLFWKSMGFKPADRILFRQELVK